jgi:hypothetical protein
MGNDGGWGDVEFTWILKLRTESSEQRIETNKEQGTKTAHFDKLSASR